MESQFNYYVLCILVRNHECSENENQRIAYAYLVNDWAGRYVFSEDIEKRKVFTSEKIAMEVCETLNNTKPLVTLDDNYGWKVKRVCEPGRIVVKGKNATNCMPDLMIMGDPN